jgi:predicted RNA binding protein YcfA (HicA-like mRNA interferase family)
MPPVPLLRPAEVVGAFEKLGWRVVRRRGSHIILTKTGSVATRCRFPTTRRSRAARFGR